MATKIVKILVLILVLIAVGWGIRKLATPKAAASDASAADIISNLKQ